MDKYIIVCNGSLPRAKSESCIYLSSVDKDGLHFSQNIDDAIVLDGEDKCVFFARALTRAFRTVDVYSVKERITRSFEYVW